MIDALARLGQRVPPEMRRWVAESRLGPRVRRLLNLSRGPRSRLTVVPLAAPLEGHRMLLDWDTHKGFVFGVYEPHVVRALEAVVGSGSLVVDVGAHIGYFTLLLRKLVGSRGRVVAFEPWPPVAAVLKRNATMNGYQDIIIEQRAVTDETRLITMAPRNDHPLSSMSAMATAGAVVVDAVSLDDYFSPSDPVSFVKIDVEGAERLVLQGMQRILTDHRPMVILELHLAADPIPVELTEQRGYRIRMLDSHHILAVPI